jgi:hypothetical protein
MNPNLRDLARLTKNPNLEEEIKKSTLDFLDLSSFVFVPELGSYVSDNITMYNATFIEIKKTAEQLGAFLLTPAQWWGFYDYCIIHRNDVYHTSIINPEYQEYLDAYVEDDIESMVVESHVAGDKLVGRKIDKCLPRQVGGFNRADVNPWTGIPEKVYPKNDCDFDYVPYLFEHKTVLVRSYFDKKINFAFNGGFDLRRIDLGARFCFKHESKP